MAEKRQPKRDYSLLIEKLLQPYGVWENGDGRFRCACPIHGGDNPTSFSIFSNGSWRCFRCGAFGDLARLVSKLQRVSLLQAKEYLADSPVPFRTIEELPELPPWSERHSGIKYTILNDAILGAYRGYCPNYLINRRYSRSVLKDYEIGYDTQNSKIVLPVRDVDRKLVGLTYRVDFDGDLSQPAKYFHDHFLKASHLYGFYKWSGKDVERLFITEGQLDTVRLHQLEKPSVAIMGSDMSDDQVALLNRYAKCKQLVLAYDNDEAGEKATKQSISKLRSTRFGRSLGILRYSAKDPGELDETSRLYVEPWYSTMKAKA